jgi:protein-disulfide isomerase
MVAIAATVWIILDPGFRATGPDAMSSDAFGQRVHDYLLKNPEVLVEAIQRLEARRSATESTEAQAALKARANDVFHDPASPVAGNPDGDVTMVEFFDYNCPYCRKVASVVHEAKAGDPGLRIVYKEWPVLGPRSVFAAKAALAAHRQGRYKALHDALLQMRGAADEASTLRAATEIGLDVPRLKADMADPALQAALDRNFELAGALRLAGTPGFVIGDQILRGATDLATLQKLIENARKKP